MDHLLKFNSQKKYTTSTYAYLRLLLSNESPSGEDAHEKIKNRFDEANMTI